MNRTTVRTGAALGLAHVVVVIAGFALSGPSQSTTLAAPTADVTEWYASPPRTYAPALGRRQRAPPGRGTARHRGPAWGHLGDAARVPDLRLDLGRLRVAAPRGRSRP